MQIDDLEAADIFAEKLQSSVPIKVTPAKEFLQTLREKGESATSKDKFIVDWVKYSGDVGGIMCAVVPREPDKQRFVVSITHLKIDPQHPLASEVQAYKRQRIRGLKLFELEYRAKLMAEMAETTPSKRKRASGFGK